MIHLTYQKNANYTQYFLERNQTFEKKLTNQILGNTKEKQLIPYKVIHYICQNNLQDFMTIVTKNVFQEKLPNLGNNYNTSTSCIHTVYLLAALFLGKAEAKKKLKQIKLTYTFEFHYPLPSGKKEPFFVSSLFDGVLIRNYQQVKHEQEALNLTRMSYHLFFSSVQPFMFQIAASSRRDEECKFLMQQFFSEYKYPFNGEVIQTLKNEIEEKELQVHDSCSYIYIVVAPLVDKDNVQKIGYQHAFVLEQFFHPEKKEPYYRLYQSWINKASLKEDLEKQTEWSKEGLEFFFEKLNHYTKKKVSKKDSEACFGYSTCKKLFLFFKDNSFYGASLRYLSFQINPEDCLKNFLELVQEYPILRDEI